jgi:N-acetylmuramoyl-L-alanine amidase
MRVLIECGHGGMINGEYQCLANGKRYTFKKDGLTVYEGVVNRQIAQKVIKRLQLAKIPFIDLNSEDQTDMPLGERTRIINNLYKTDKNLWLLSIHSNAYGTEIVGDGEKPNGCETFVAINAAKRSQMIQLIAEKHYKADGYKWRGSKTANFWMLRESDCPALLVENLFYTNRKDAEFLLSPNGQNKIADTLYKIIKEVNG